MKKPSDNLHVFLIILNWNGKQDTLDCLSSTQKINYSHFTTIVVDNGSTDGSVEAIRKAYPDVFVIDTKENLGFAEGNNVGIRYAMSQGADAVCLLNNDTVVDPGFLSAFVQMAQTSSQIGVLGGKAYLYGEKTTLDHLGGKWNPSTGQFTLVGHRALEDGFSWESPQHLDYVCGVAFFITKAALDTVGLLEPQFFLIWEESDYCFRVRRQGLQVMSCPQAKLWHKVSASFTGKPHSTYFWWRNRLLWIARNCTKKEQKNLFWKVLLPEISHLSKLYAIKSTELAILRLFCKKECLVHKQERTLRYRAALQGVYDYCKKKFGQGPAWIYQKPR